MDNKIDFEVMGLDSDASEFLNWCMKHRDNLEYERACGIHDLKSASTTLFFDDFGVIARIDKQVVNRRQVFHTVIVSKTLDNVSQ